MSSETSRASSRPVSPAGEIERRLGVLPNFFRLAPEAPEIGEKLWGFAEAGYLDNPLPSLFKERLFVYVSRFCDVRYCLARHVGFLVGLGRPAGDPESPLATVEQAAELLRHPVPEGDQLLEHQEALRGLREPLAEIPGPDSPLETSIFACAAQVFLQSSHAPESLEALREALPGTLFRHLLLFLAFVRTAHFWTRLHPELELEDDIEELLAVHQSLAECVLRAPSSEPGIADDLLRELDSLKRERELYRELGRSEERYRLLFEQAVDGIFIADSQGIFLDVNPAGCSLLAAPREEIVGAPLAAIVPSENSPRMDELMDQLVDDRTLRREWDLRRPDGSMFPGEIVVRRLPDGHLQGLLRDVSERKRAQQLEASHRRVLELIAQDAPIGAVCEAVVRMLEEQSTTGMLASILLLDASGSRLLQGAAPSLPEAYNEAIDGLEIGPDVGSCGTAAFRGEPVYVSDIEHDPLWSGFVELALENGLRACWSTPIVSSGSGEVLGTFAMYYPEPREANPADLRLVDIATRTTAIAIERRRNQRALHESEERFRALADNIPQLAWIAEAGSDGHIRWFNQNWLDYAGTTASDMEGLGWHSILHPDHADRVISKFSRHVREGLDWEDTFPLRRADGQYRWFLSRMKCIRDDSGQIARIFGTNTDVTQQRELESELRRVTDDLAQADRRKDEFLATLAHELRNPLAALTNTMELLVLDEDPETARTVMKRQIGQLRRLVDDLMDVSRITLGKIELHRRVITLQSVVRQALETSAPFLNGGEHPLDVRMPEEPVWIDGDLTRLGQVVMNLLSNAGKYSERGSPISLVVERSSGSASLTVKDRGVGIDAEQMPQIFEMFAQVHGRGRSAEGGLGVGLSLVKRLLELHGGEIEARSDGPGAGSEFVVRLPLASPPEREAAPAEVETLGPSEARRVLIVDDNRDNADTLGLILETAGNETRIAYDGHSGVKIATEFRPDVVLLDIGLPDIDGYEACQRIRSLDWSRGTLLVAITGWGQERDRRRSEEAGFDLHLVKPVDPGEITDLIAAGRPPD